MAPGSYRDVLKQGVLAADNVVYCVTEQNGPLVAIDGDTGKVRRRYEAGGRSWNQQNGPQMLLPTVLHEGILYQAAGDTAYALDAATGDMKWKTVHTGDLGPLPTQGTKAINDVPTTDGTLLYLKGLAIDPATGEFRKGRPRLDAKRPAVPDPASCLPLGAADEPADRS